MLSRQKFSILTDTGGDFIDTGPPVSGKITQFWADLTNMDTGCSLLLEMKMDTGYSVIADYDNVGGTEFLRAPMILAYDTGGAVVTNHARNPVINVGRLRLTVNQGAGDTGGKTGTAFVWTEK